MTIDVGQEIDLDLLYHEYCPICASIMDKQLISGVLFWVCPDIECGYIQPVSSNSSIPDEIGN